MDLPVNPSATIELLRAWFYAKDRSIVMADDTFIESDDNATSPGNPTTNRSRLFYQLSNPPPGRGWYSLDENGRKYQFSGDVASWQSACSLFQALPGLRGFWPMSAYGSTGQAFDQSGNGRTLTYNGNPTYNYDDLAPYIDLDGTGDYLSRADEAGLDIIGNETYVANNGLTMGGWFWMDTIAGVAGLMAKQNGGLSYVLQRSGATVAFFVDDGLGAVSSGSVAVAATQWYHIVCRFDPSNELKIFVNFDNTNSNVVGIPATIQNSTAAFTIGVQVAPATNLFDGRASMCFLSASYVPDATIFNLFEQTRTMYGV